MGLSSLSSSWIPKSWGDKCRIRIRSMQREQPSNPKKKLKDSQPPPKRFPWEFKRSYQCPYQNPEEKWWVPNLSVGEEPVSWPPCLLGLPSGLEMWSKINWPGGRLENCKEAEPKKKGGQGISSSKTWEFFEGLKILLVFTSPKIQKKTALWVERHDLQGNLDIQPPINRCNQLDFCPSRAVAFQCPETSNRHKWQVESYLGCLLKIWGDLKWKIHNIHKFDGQKSVMDMISLYIYIP